MVGGLECRVHRNYYGAQRESFVALVKRLDPDLQGPLDEDLQGVFIRAPYIESIRDDEVKVLAVLQRGGEEQIVAVREKNILGLTFHPELTDSCVWHEYFLNMIRAAALAQ